MIRMKKGITGRRYGSREEWLELRRGSVGGSEAGAVLNEHEYEDAYTLWCAKRGAVAPVKANEAMRLGTALEDYAAERFCRLWSARTGKSVRVRRRKLTIFNAKYPFAHANIDREVIGERAVLECKTSAGSMIGRLRAGDMPRGWYWQLQHYMAVGGYERGYLICVDRTGHGEPVITAVERCEKDIDRLMRAEEAFMERVASGEAPPPTGIDRAREINRERWPEESVAAPPVTLPPEWERRLDERARLKAEIAENEKRARAIDAELQTILNVSARASCGPYSVSWMTRACAALDREALLRDHPDIDLSPYRTAARVLRVSRKG